MHICGLIKKNITLVHRSTLDYHLWPAVYSIHVGSVRNAIYPGSFCLQKKSRAFLCICKTKKKFDKRGDLL